MGRDIDSLPARFPHLVLVRDDAPIPHAPLAQSTDRIGWSELELAVLCAKASTGEDTVSLPADGVVRSVRPARDGDGFGVRDDPREGTVRWKIRILG